jgi:rhodanese-related sulfurtransferase
VARHRSACLFAAVVAAVLLGTVDCRNAAQPGDSTQITAAELAGLVRTRTAPLILDVRSPREYAAGHVPAAINIPHTELAGRFGELGIDKSDELVVYCLSGRRAALAEQVLAQAGYTRVRSLEGQLRAWRGEGYPVE